MDSTQDPTANNGGTPNTVQNRGGDESLPMCSICHSEPPVNAIQLNCDHIFCYLCIKSASETTGACALCRTKIGIEFNFQEHEILGPTRVPSSQNGFYWYYEGYQGWWMYDADTNRDIEIAHQRGDSVLEKYIAGCFYSISLSTMTQLRKDGEGRSRKIRRATLDLDNILGLAGIKGQEFDDILDMMRCAERDNLSVRG